MTPLNMCGKNKKVSENEPYQKGVKLNKTYIQKKGHFIFFLPWIIKQKPEGVESLHPTGIGLNPVDY